MHITRIPWSLRFADSEKPYVESIRGRREPKVSPKRMHGRLQLRLGRLIEDWAAGRGEVATEWRFYLLDGRGEPSSLVPDVAYASFERLPLELPGDARECPRIAPDIAVEIVSVGDDERSLAEKTQLYLAHGARAVVIVRPLQRTVEVFDAHGSQASAANGTLVIPGVEGLRIDVASLFAGI